MIALIDYSAGNVRSIENAFKRVGAETYLAKKPGDLARADAIVLPGVGNFGDAMKRLERYRKPLALEIAEGKPFLGLCLGIQAIMEESEEARGVKGLRLLEGGCKRFSGKLKVPHMGWNTIKVEKKTPILEGIKSGEFFYFVHSYYPTPKDRRAVAATTGYGIEFPSVISRGNIHATQFHPEKSGEAGLRVLSNFMALA